MSSQKYNNKKQRKKSTDVQGWFATSSYYQNILLSEDIKNFIINDLEINHLIWIKYI